MATKLLRRDDIKPNEDYGFFGPDSVTWRVWSYPTSVTIGFQRAVVVEELDPALIAAVDATNAVRYRPRTRYDRTLKYFALVALGDTRSAIMASNVLVKVHAKATGTDPLTGNRYDANDPHSQLWIHLTAWHSILYAFERYGPGRLSPDEERQYWEECAIAAELQTCDPADVPRSREGIQRYFEEMRPKLAGSEAAQSMMDHLLTAKVMLPQMPWILQPGVWVVNKALRYATIATMPQWMRRMAGLRQHKAVDSLIRPVMRISFWAANLSKRVQVLTLPFISPGTAPVVAPVLLNIPPEHETTLTPAQARARYAILPPREEYAAFREKVAARTAARDGATVGPEIPESIALLGPVR